MPNELTLLIGTERIGGWKSVEVKRSITTMAGTFSVELTDIWGADPTGLVPELAVKVLIGDTVLLNGYIDRMSISTNVNAYDISASGRCRTSDLVDCSVVNKPGMWKEIGLLKLAQELTEPFGIQVEQETDLGDNLSAVSISTGETVLDVLSKVCEERAVLAIGNSSGNLSLTVAGNFHATDHLSYGGDTGNIISAEGQFNYRERFSVYQVKGQQKGTGRSWDAAITGPYGEATDEAIERFRPKLINSDKIITNAGAKKRAAWEAQVRAGRSNSISVTVPGWTQSDGSLWRENLKVFTHIPPLRISTEMLIEEIVYTLANGGKTATMRLVHPSTYSAEPKPKQKKKAVKRTANYGWL